MTQEIKIKVKDVFSHAIIVFILIATVNYFAQPDFSKFSFINKRIKEHNHSQKIAPNRLYINVWRNTKQEFYDSSMNNQDWNRWKYKYLKHIKTNEDADIAINTMLASLNDPKTKFLSSSSFKKRKTIIDSEFTGIGILFDKTGEKIVVNHVLDNSSAKTNEVQTGDIIVAVNGKDISYLEKEKILDLIETKKEKKISIVVNRNGKLLKKELEINTVQIKTIEYEITTDNIGIIRITNLMGEKAIIDFVNAITATNKTKGLIIDLRNNFGGMLENAIEMSNYLFNHKKIVTIKTKKNKNYEIFAGNESIFKTKPIIILVNKSTASASEILAGTLQENLNAKILGEKTYGKNSIQQVIPLANKTGLIITSGKYILPSGKDIHNKGIEPDILEASSIIKINDKPLEKALNIIRQQDSRIKKN